MSTWVQYIMGGVFKIVVTAIILKMFGSLMGGLAGIAAATLNQPGNHAITFVIMSIVGMGMIMALKEADGIASGLTGGFAIGSPGVKSVMGAGG